MSSGMGETAASTAPADTLTVLRSRHLRLAKRLRQDGGADGYDRAKHLDAATVPVANLAGILVHLRRLLPRPDLCVIRGELLDGPRTFGMRRLLHMDRKTGELPTLRDVPRRWLALDLEGVPRSPDLPASDLAGCAAAALAGFPDPIQNATCIIVASASHGLKPDIRLRAWFWLVRPTWGHELKRWLQGLPCDKSVFGAVQPIYTAAPALMPGVVDPITTRLIVLPGLELVEVPPPAALAAPPIPPPPRSTVDTSSAQRHRYVRAALERAATAIANAGEGNRHPLIVAETCRLARFVAPGLLSSSVIASVVRQAAQQAGKDDAEELDAAIAYGLANPWTAGPLPGGHQHG